MAGRLREPFPISVSAPPTGRSKGGRPPFGSLPTTSTPSWRISERPARRLWPSLPTSVGRARRVGRRSRRLRDLSRRAERLTRCGDPSAVSVRQARREDAEAMARVIAALSEEGLIATEPPVDLDPRVQWFKDAIEGEGLGARWNSRCGPTSGRPAAGSRSVGAGTSALGPRGHMHPRNDTARGTEAPRAAGEGAWTSSQSRPSQLSREGMERLAEATGPTVADPRSTC